MAGQNTDASSSPTIDASGSGTTSSMKDPGWKYVTLADPPNKNNLKCIFCFTVTKAGINRAKQHIVGGYRNTKTCPAVPPNVRKEIQEYMEKKAAAAKSTRVPEQDFDFTNMDTFGDSEDELRIELEDGDSYKGQKGKKARTKGPIDKLFTATNEKLMREKKREITLRQTTVNEAYKKEQRIEVCQSIARWLYDAAVSFNVVKYKSWKKMFTDVANYGRGFKAPSYHEVRVPLLKQAVAEVKSQLKSYEEERKTCGCSIMIDGWIDKRQRTLIKFLVNSPRGTVFIELIDASSYAKTGEKMFELLDSFIEKIGEANVVQVVTDNASSNVLAGKLLEAKRPNLFWTPYAAHCIDLMLEDIGKLDIVTRTLKRAMSINGYTYIRPGVVHMLRTFTGQTEFVRAGTTRFATTYLTLRRFYKLKNNLRKMFTSEEGISSKWANEQAGRNVCNIFLMPSFFANILYILKIFGPLMRVLRLVDGERLPAMAYIYEAMDRAKEAIATSFNGKEGKDEAVFQIIDRGWNNQLHRPLHAAGHFLNPQFYYDNPDIAHNEEIMDGLYETLKRLRNSKVTLVKMRSVLILMTILMIEEA